MHGVRRNSVLAKCEYLVEDAGQVCIALKPGQRQYASLQRHVGCPFQLKSQGLGPS